MPICPIFPVGVPTNTKSSGNPCIRAASLGRQSSCRPQGVMKRPLGILQPAPLVTVKGTMPLASLPYALGNLLFVRSSFGRSLVGLSRAKKPRAFELSLRHGQGDVVPNRPAIPSSPSLVFGKRRTSVESRVSPSSLFDTRQIPYGVPSGREGCEPPANSLGQSFSHVWLPAWMACARPKMPGRTPVCAVAGLRVLRHRAPLAMWNILRLPDGIPRCLRIPCASWLRRFP